MLKPALAFLAVLSFGFSTLAQSHSVPSDTHDQWTFVNGNKLFEWCSSAPSETHSNCLMYVAGVVDLVGALQPLRGTNGQPVWNLPAVCLPRETVVAQLADVVTKYLREHPEDRAKPATSLILMAIETGWRCPALAISEDHK